jgi:hypothetical protein
MFERFSERARQVVVLAQEEARELGHAFIGAEHLLLGVVHLRAGGEMKVGDVRAAVVDVLGRSQGPVEGQIPFTTQAMAALRRLAEMRLMQVEPAHIMQALMDDESVAAIVARCGGAPPPPPPAVDDPLGDLRRAFAVTIGDEVIGDLGNPRTDVRMVGAILRRDGLAAGWLRAAGIDEAWVREFGGE